MSTLGARARTTVFLLAITVWLGVLAATHHAARSPYTYVSQMHAESITHVVNPDAVTAAYPLTRFLYDGTAPRWERTANARLPLHSFAASIALSFVRTYLAANTLLNVAALVLLAYVALTAARRFGIDDLATLAAILTVYSLPPVVAYIGQPLQYVVGTVINALVMLTALSLTPDTLRRPLVPAGLLGILTLNYDWYVWGAALATWLILTIRFRRLLDALIFLVLGVFPGTAWTRFVELAAGGKVSTQNQDAFRDSILFGWSEVFTGSSPVLGTLISLEIGARAAVLETLGFIWWPLLIACAAALWTGRAAVPACSSAGRLLALLAGWFALEQLLGAAMLVENHPRRALPVVFAFGCAWCWALHRLGRNPRWRTAFAALVAASLLLAHVDLLTGRPGFAIVAQGETVRDALKAPLRFTAYEMPQKGVIAEKQRVVTGSVASAPVAGWTPFFVFAQLFLAVAMAGLFALLARARLVPAWSALAFAGTWLVSLVARLA